MAGGAHAGESLGALTRLLHDTSVPLQPVFRIDLENTDDMCNLTVNDIWCVCARRRAANRPLLGVQGSACSDSRASDQQCPWGLAAVCFLVSHCSLQLRCSAATEIWQRVHS